MGIQDIIVFAIVAMAGIFVARQFRRQFSHGEGGKKCADCELNKVVRDKQQHRNKAVKS